MLKIVNSYFFQKYKNRLLLKYKYNRNFVNGLTILLLSMLIVYACNPNKEKWLNKKWHSLVGHYNIYFNGEQKLNDAIEVLNKGHVNDFNNILAIFPYGNDAAAKGVLNILDEAMKKFSGTIQLHKVGSYTDEAWFAIAKTHFFKRDYYACQEAMQYMISKYPLEYKNLSTAWIAKSYMGLGKPMEAEAVIGLVLSSKNINKKDVTEVYLTAADVNIKLEKYKSAIENLNKVFAEGSLNKDQKIRYRFILGQLYSLANDNINAIYNFNKVISLVPSYEFAFNANINITRLYNINDKKAVNMVRKSLKKMAKDDKNTDYLGQIYYELGKLELSQKNYQPAIISFKKSIQNSNTAANQKAKSCYELAKLYFDLKEYKFAKAYYDTTASTFDKNEKNYPIIIGTKNVLNDLINNLTVYETEDSLQMLSKLSKKDLSRKVEEWILADNKKKEQEIKAARNQKIIENSIAANQNQTANNTNAPVAFDNSANGSQWYFYNTNLSNSGANEFFNSRKWGNRLNEDYWRLSQKEKPSKPNSEKDSTEEGENVKPKDTAKEKNKDEVASNKDSDKQADIFGDKNKDAWVKNIPYSNQAIENSNLNMLEALHNIGTIYYSKIKNYKEAITYFNILQSKFPNSEYEPETWYYLHKSHIENKESKNASKYKDDLLNNYPNNTYALLLLGKPINTASTDANKEVVVLYDSVFNAFKLGNYQTVFDLKAQVDKKYPGNLLRPKFELINALAIGKTSKIEEYKLALLSVSKEFPKTDVALKADEILAILNKAKETTIVQKKDSILAEFNMDANDKYYYVFAVKDAKANYTEFVEKLYAYNEAYASEDNLKVNALMGNEGYQYILIREFPNQKKAEDYYKGIVANNVITSKLKVNQPYLDFVISITNYKNVMRDKQMDKYYNFYKKLQEKH